MTLHDSSAIVLVITLCIALLSMPIGLLLGERRVLDVGSVAISIAVIAMFAFFLTGGH